MMLTKAQAHKIIQAATDGDSTRALLMLVDLLTDPKSQEFDEEPRVSEPWTLGRVKALASSELMAALRLHGLAPGPNTDLDWNMAMGAIRLAAGRVTRRGAFSEAWDEIVGFGFITEVTAEQVARASLWAVVKPK